MNISRSRGPLPGRAAIIASAVLYGSLNIFALRLAHYGANPLYTALFRTGLSLPFLYLADRLSEEKRKQKRPAPKMRPGLILLSFLYGITPVLLFLSYERIPTGLTTTLHFTYPALVLIISKVFLKKKTSVFQAFCAAVSLAGVAFLSAVQGDLSGIGIALALLSALTFSVYVVYLSAGGFQENISPYRLLFRMNLISSIITLILMFLLGKWKWEMRPTGLIYAFSIALFIGVLASLLFQTGIRLNGPSEAALFSPLEPVTSVLIGIFLFGEKISAGRILGILLILGSVTALAVYDKLQMSRSGTDKSKQN